MVHYTKSGQPYIILASGKARFIKKKSARRKKSRRSYGLKYKIKRRVSSMVRRKKYHRRGGFGLGRILSTKNIMYTVGAMILLPKFVNVDPKIAAAAGGFAGAGIPGAVAGYVVAPMVSGVAGTGSGSDVLG